MRRLFSFSVMLVCVLSLAAGCDFIRASLGKPTSADLVKISDEIKAREKFLRDSIAAVRAAEARLEAKEAAEEEPAPAPAPVATPAPVAAPAAPAAATSSLKKYYAVAGAFKQPEGAQQYVQKLQEKGFQVHLFDFRSGLKVVCIEGSDSIEDVKRDIASLKEMALSDSDPWIYNTNQKLHK